MKANQHDSKTPKHQTGATVTRLEIPVAEKLSTFMTILDQLTHVLRQETAAITEYLELPGTLSPEVKSHLSLDSSTLRQKEQLSFRMEKFSREWLLDFKYNLSEEQKQTLKSRIEEFEATCRDNETALSAMGHITQARLAPFREKQANVAKAATYSSGGRLKNKFKASDQEGTLGFTRFKTRGSMPASSSSPRQAADSATINMTL